MIIWHRAPWTTYISVSTTFKYNCCSILNMFQQWKETVDLWHSGDNKVEMCNNATGRNLTEAADIPPKKEFAFTMICPLNVRGIKGIPHPRLSPILQNKQMTQIKYKHVSVEYPLFHHFNTTDSVIKKKPPGKWQAAIWSPDPCSNQQSKVICSLLWIHYVTLSCANSCSRFTCPQALTVWAGFACISLDFVAIISIPHLSNYAPLEKLSKSTYRRSTFSRTLGYGYW